MWEKILKLPTPQNITLSYPNIQGHISTPLPSPILFPIEQTPDSHPYYDLPSSPYQYI